MTYALMALLILVLTITFLWGAKYDSKKDSFMSIEDTNFLRGFWCIIVLFVHVPVAYQNRIQDMLGSFAYIGVTFFFMTSAYGLKWSIEHKTKYMDLFWRKRLPSLLIPALIANMLSGLVELIRGTSVNVWSFFNINPWVKVLLVNYFFFWLIYYVLAKFTKQECYKDLMICILCIVWSLEEYITGHLAMGWHVERLGFIYGILAAAFYPNMRRWVHKAWLKKTVILMFLSIALGITYLKWKHVPLYGDYLLRVVLGIMLTSFVITVTSNMKVGNGLSHFLGSISYEIFLLHGIVFTALSSIKMNSGVFIIVSIVLTITIAAITNKLTNIVLRTI